MEEQSKLNPEMQSKQTTQPENTDNNPPKRTSSCCSRQNCLRMATFIIACLALIGVIVLWTMQFCCNGSCPTSSDTPIAKTLQSGDLKIAYVNTDSLLLQYQYAKDLEANLANYQKSLESNYETQVRKLQADYENYLKTGDKLTLTQQKQKEEDLTIRQQQLPQLSQQMIAQLQERQAADNKKLLDAVYAFIREYNATHDQYNIILTHAYANSATLYIEDGMDITHEIISGLNEEYKQVKEK